MAQYEIGEHVIEFTEYMLPNGRREQMRMPWFTEEVAKRAEKIVEAGFVFEMELLRNRTGSFTITKPDEGDIAIELVPDTGDGMMNRAAMVHVVSRMIMEFKFP